MNVNSLKRRLDKLGADGSDSALVYRADADQKNFRPGIDQVTSCDMFPMVFAVGSQSLPVTEYQRRFRAMMDLVNGLSRTVIEIEMPPFGTHGDFWTRHAAASENKKAAVYEHAAN